MSSNPKDETQKNAPVPEKEMKSEPEQSGQETLTLEEYLTPEHLGSALYKVMKEWHDSGVTVSPQKVVQGGAGRLQATFVKAPPRPDQPPEKE